MVSDTGDHEPLHDEARNPNPGPCLFRDFLNATLSFALWALVYVLYSDVLVCCS